MYRVGLAVLWQSYKRMVGLPIISILDNGTKFILYPNSTNSTGNIYVKTYEAEYIYFLRKHIVKGGMIIDIGAHMGLFTLLLNNLFKGGYCFEPAKDTYMALQNNLFLNRLMDEFIPINSAVSDNDGTHTLKMEGAFSGINHLIETGEENSKDAEIVSTVSLDTFLIKNNILSNINFLKIDTEGHELTILMGSQQMLQNNPNLIILMENNCIEKVLELFAKVNFKVFAISSNGNVLSDNKSIANAYNIFAVGSLHPLYATL